MRMLSAVLSVIGVLFAFIPELTTAADPTTLPLLQFSDLSYVGGFRLPRDIPSGTFSMGGLPLTFNPDRNSLFVGNRQHRISEVAIPDGPLNTANPGAMPFGTFLQDFADPTEGHLSDVAPTDVALFGLLVSKNRLYGTASIYYDANGVQRVSHYSRSLNLSEPSFRGMSSVWDPVKSGFVSGYMAVVPAEWQSALGAPAITGQCCLPITWRTSWGPSAFAFDPAQIGQGYTVPATPLLYYSSEHPTLGPWMGSNGTWGGNVEMGGLALIAGTRTALYIGRNGLGPFCYGEGTSDPNLVGTMSHEGAVYCYDPTSTAKGQHGYPYRYQIWAYDIAEFAKVKAGLKQPWEVTPYGVWPFSFPVQELTVRLGGVGYDPARQLLYVSQLQADKDGYENRPVIQVLKLNAPTSAPPIATQPLPPPPVPAASTKVEAVTLVANKPAPQAVGTSITFTAAPTGGVAPLQYKWFVYNNVSWAPITGWSTSQNYTWTPVSANAGYKVGVWVKSATNAADALEQSITVDFPIGSGTAPAPSPIGSGGGAVSAVGITSNMAAPQSAGTSITFTAAASGGAAPVQYKWFVYNNVTWSAVTGWSGTPTYTWTPAAANAGYKVGVWAKSASNAADVLEASAAVDFAISSGGSIGAPPLPTGSGVVTSVNISANRAAPQPAGTSTTFTAVASGGAAPQQFKWWIWNGSTWSVAAGWSTQNTFTWTPAAANSNYKVGVWARSGSTSGDTREASVEFPFPISAATSATPPPPSSSASVTSVVLASDKPAPQPKGTTVVFTAIGTGGVAPHRYKWFINHGSEWEPLTGWVNSNTFSWTPQDVNALYHVGVWIRSATNSSDVPESSVETPFPIVAATSAPPPTGSGKVTGVTLTANKSNTGVGVPVTFTAVPAGGVAPQQYKWFFFNGVMWVATTGWSTSNTYTWTPTAKSPYYRIGVWVRSATSTADLLEASKEYAYPVR